MFSLQMANDGFRQKRRRSSALDPPVSPVTLEASMEDVWRMLPEDILDLIILRLPFPAQCRFRCVSRKWKSLISLPQPCMILSRWGDKNKGRIFCDSERKWFSLPYGKPPYLARRSLKFIAPGPHWRTESVELEWEVADVDAGLVCYRCNLEGQFWFWVCNPLKTACSRLIPPAYSRGNMDLRRYGAEYGADPPKLKLVVDRTCKTFKILVMVDWSPWTAVYESITSRWQLYDSHPTFQSLEIFVWENVIYAYNTALDHGHQESAVAAFNTTSGEWINVQVEMPSEFKFPTHHFFLSDNAQVMLVLYSYRKRPRPYFSVWKMLGEGLDPSITAGNTIVKWEKWEKVYLGSERSIVDLVGHRLARACCGPKYMWFMFRTDKIADDVSKSHKCVRYSFVTKTWSMGGCSGGWGGSPPLYTWEPRLDMVPSSDAFMCKAANTFRH